MNQWIEGIHYYINEEGLVVMTEKYHQERGYCCGNGCKHCPYQHKNVTELEKSGLLNNKPDAGLDLKS